MQSIALSRKASFPRFKPTLLSITECWDRKKRRGKGGGQTHDKLDGCQLTIITPYISHYQKQAWYRTYLRRYMGFEEQSLYRIKIVTNAKSTEQKLLNIAYAANPKQFQIFLMSLRITSHFKRWKASNFVWDVHSENHTWICSIFKAYLNLLFQCPIY